MTGADQQRADNRRDFPLAARAVDYLREIFGEAEVTFASQDGRTFGRRIGEDEVMVSYPVPETKKEARLRQRVGGEIKMFSFKVSR